MHDAYVKSTLASGNSLVSSGGVVRSGGKPAPAKPMQATTVKVFKHKKPLALPKKSQQAESTATNKDQGPMSYAAIVTSLSNTNISKAN